MAGLQIDQPAIPKDYGVRCDGGYAPAADSWSDEIAGGLLVMTPVKAIAWSSFPEDVTRFTFDRPRP